MDNSEKVIQKLLLTSMYNKLRKTVYYEPVIMGTVGIYCFTSPIQPKIVLTFENHYKFPALFPHLWYRHCLPVYNSTHKVLHGQYRRYSKH